MSLARRLMNSVPVEQAIGSVLCHDITQIVPGKTKGPLFRKGHIVTKEDVPALLRLGKEHLYIYQRIPGILHENEAAWRIAKAVAGAGLRFSEPSEGRINFHSTVHGLLRIGIEPLAAINSLDAIAVATLHTMQEVQVDQIIGGTRIVPLLIEESSIAQLEAMVGAPCIDVLPFRKANMGIVTTGSEIYHGRIQDAFGSILTQKMEALGGRIIAQRLTSDDVNLTSLAICELINAGADMIAVTGGMSVDPDDNTPSAIRHTGARVVSYGSPTFPGAMFLLAYLGDVPILGLPGCVMYHKASIFDLIVPRILAGLDVTRKDIAMLGHGGYCAGCAECRFPACAFGKGS